MLSIRQTSIIKELCDHKEQFTKASTLATQNGVSTKTIHNDFKEIRDIILLNGADVEAQSGKGYRMIIRDAALFSAFFHENVEHPAAGHNFSEQSNRVSYLLKCLLNTSRYLLSDDLADEMYISRSRVAADIKLVRQILEKYDLKITHKPNYGIKIIGSEINKRLCIIKEKVSLDQDDSSDIFRENEMLKQIGDIVMENLIQNHYKVSDIVYQNLVLHIYVAIQRISTKNYIEKGMGKESFFGHEYEIAERIMIQISHTFHLAIETKEIEFLAINLQGKRSYEDNDIISEEIDKFVLNILTRIRDKMEVDFTKDVDLRISLSLHIIPLLTRAQHNMLLENTMLEEIKQNYPLAFDMAAVAAGCINQDYRIRLNEDEVGYLAVHFSLALQNDRSSENLKKVLIISSSRRGETLLIQRQFLNWFHDLIQQLDILNFVELDDLDTSAYDVIFTTSLMYQNIPRQAVRINYFLNELDHEHIRKALMDEASTSELLQYFKKELFMYVRGVHKKDEILQLICNQCSAFVEPAKLYDAVCSREELGFTSFPNFIAVPHPDHLFTEQTFVVTCLLEKPIQWNESLVYIVLLVNVAKGRDNDLRALFSCISKLMMNRDCVEEILKKGTYDDYMSILRSLLK